MANRILVVAHERSLRESRAAVLETQGYAVVSVNTDEEALELLEREVFDLVLLGRNELLSGEGLDQRLREKYPNLLTLKIEAIADEDGAYSSRSTFAPPQFVLKALAEMLGVLK